MLSTGFHCGTGLFGIRGLSVVACRFVGMKQQPPPDADPGTLPGGSGGAALGVKPAAAAGAMRVAPPDATEPSAWAGLLRSVADVAGEPTWRCGEDDLVDQLRQYEAVRARLDAHRLALVRE